MRARRSLRIVSTRIDLHGSIAITGDALSGIGIAGFSIGGQPTPLRGDLAHCLSEFGIRQPERVMVSHLAALSRHSFADKGTDNPGIT
jgi:hypothetical protein